MEVGRKLEYLYPWAKKINLNLNKDLKHPDLNSNLTNNLFLNCFDSDINE